MTKKPMTEEDLAVLKAASISIAPTGDLTDDDFKTRVKISEIKKQMMTIRALYTKYSGNPSGCFCKTGILTILKWIKKLEIKNDTTGTN